MLTLEGLPASPGIASGEAYVVQTPEDAPNVQDHHILVAEQTTPDYVEAMRRAMGIITAKGGTTSHAAIVAREMGKPCIVAVSAATSLIHKGATVRMDGKTGKVLVFFTPQEYYNYLTKGGS